MKKEDIREEYLNKIALLTAENENLASKNHQLHAENELLRQQFSTLKSLLSIYELGRKYTTDNKEEITDSVKRFPSLSFVRSEKIGSLSPSEDTEVSSFKFNSIVKTQEKLVILAKQVEFLKLEFNFIVQEMKSSFENAAIEFQNFSKNLEFGSAKPRTKVSEKESHKNKLEKLANIFEKY